MVDDIKEYINSVEGWNEALHIPSNIFNSDESGFLLYATVGKAWPLLASRCIRNIYKEAADEETQITVQVCLNTLSDFMPPYTVYPGQLFIKLILMPFLKRIIPH